MSLRIVATSDTHVPVDPVSIPDGDVFIHAGDIMSTGYLDEWQWAVQWLSELPHETKIFVPGNHDFHLQVYPGPALQDMRRAGVTVVGFPGNINFASVLLKNGMRVLGLPYVTDLPRWAFNINEEDLQKELEVLALADTYDIVVSHSPIHKFLDFSNRNKQHAGVKAYHDFCQRMNPKIWIHGHIHEGFGQTSFNETAIYNVSMCDRNHQHVNGAVVIDVGEKEASISNEVTVYFSDCS